MLKKMLISLIIVPIFTVGFAQAQTQNNCTCRYKGMDFKLGEKTCLKSPSGPTMARCEMQLNNTSWKFLDSPCPVDVSQSNWNSIEKVPVEEITNVMVPKDTEFQN